VSGLRSGPRRGRGRGLARRHFFLLTVFLLTGCATYWAKPGLEPGQFERESYACERDSAGLPYAPQPTYPQGGSQYGTAALGQGFSNLGSSLGDIAQRRGMYERCMRAFGYQKVDR